MRFITLSLALIAASACTSDDTSFPYSGKPDGAEDTGLEDSQIDSDEDGYTADEDCDDNDGTVYPDADELCDGLDNDCDDEIDEDPADGTAWYPDNDGDTYGSNEKEAIVDCDAPSGYVDNSSDCDDYNADVNPDASEICDGLDNDCNDLTDDNDVDVDPETTTAWYADTDGDGYGDRHATISQCDQPSGYVLDDTDCNDGEESINPGEYELCDELDNDCDDDVDEDAIDAGTFYADSDEDSYGDPDISVTDCLMPKGYTDNADDCNDDSRFIRPNATEICDGIDNDCDGNTDDLDKDVDTSTGSTFYADSDSDGYGDPDASTAACVAPSGYVSNSGDCDDGEAEVNPDEDEVCDDIDNDCDGNTDDADNSVDTSTGSTFYADSDSDGYGDVTDTVMACDAPSGYVADDTDCNDGDGAINEGAAEVCDDVDNDCDGYVDDYDSDVTDTDTFYRDFDQDGYGSSRYFVASCEAPEYYVLNGEDCEDNDAAINPDAAEVCDTVDNDCDGDIDDDDDDVDATDGGTYYPDEDSDGFGDTDGSLQACSQPSWAVNIGGDCDDSDGSVNPNAPEVCDDIDNDCDDDIDDDDDSLNSGTGSTFFADNDEDGYGDPTNNTQACDEPSGYVSDNTDCNDGDGNINPAATEICDGSDNDCDNDVDDADDSVDVTTGSTFYIDDDTDGFGDSTSSVQACDTPSGYADNDSDCNDSDGNINPSITEICDDIDNDCDDDIDDDDDSLDATTGSTFYADADLDGYGDIDAMLMACEQPSGYVVDDTDCDDDEPDANPAASEVCDGIDNNCNTYADEGVLGSGPECGAESCTAILDSGHSTGDGDYYLDPDGDGTGALYECDMSTDGGGWTVIADWDRSAGDDQTDFESLMTENFNNMGNFTVGTTALQWNDGGVDGKAMDYSVDVDFRNAGEVMFSVDYYGYSMEDSAVYFYMSTEAGDDEDLYCLGLGSGSSTYYTSTEYALIPGYTCSATATGNHTHSQSMTPYTISGMITSFSITSLHHDDGTGDYSYLYSFKAWVR